MFIPGLIIVIGLALLLKNLGIISVDIWDIIWPAIIILVGISFFHKDRCCKSNNYMNWFCKCGDSKKDDTK